MAAEEGFLKLFDSNWYERIIFSEEVPLSRPGATTRSVHQIHAEIQAEPKLSRLPTLHVRSLSDQFPRSIASFSCDSVSPKAEAVVTTPRLKTILSGAEISESSLEKVKQEEVEMPFEKLANERKIRSRKTGTVKSLSDLEFEELKGFMDLGFDFSGEHMDSRLVSIIPGLQRLGRKGSADGEENGEIEEAVVSRPYLSEAWEVLHQREMEYPLMNWKIPALGDEMDVKDQLKFWAHTVASNANHKGSIISRSFTEIGSSTNKSHSVRYCGTRLKAHTKNDWAQPNQQKAT
ncbi:hypothetical protein CJ030_MR6G005330 [Morella rubra]|uniref:DUF1685 domain-containing protein n=1 Tax=Morella rubra TaxID=262757 RepID=A0A6A1VB77_9ROSI|nr:hypothetical protein CJ030_MR6G005330 [Morella rubra]